MQKITKQKSAVTRRKILSLFLSLAMILTALPLAGVTAFAATSGDFEYTILEDGSAEITDYTGSAETLEIPSKLDGYTVTSIGYEAFAYCDLTSVTIPESVTSIGRSAFWDCNRLTSITIGNGVTSIGNEAFKYCYSLISITIPDSVTSLGWYAFEYCDSLTNVTMGNGVTSIGGSAFANCDSLTNVTIPNSVTNIDEYAFSNCKSLTSITIPNSVTSIGKRAFAYCDSLTEIKVDVNNKNYTSQDGVLFDKNITEIIQYPIGNERTSYDIPNSVTSIVEYAFDYCNLTSITIPDSVTSIGEGAFWYCDSLTSITIPDSVTSIGEDAFYSCEMLTEIRVDTNNKNYSSQDGVLFNKNKTELIQYPIGNERTSYDIPKSVTSIGDWAFHSCENLTSVTIPNSVTSIGEYAFSDTGYSNNPSNWENGVLYIDNCLIEAENDEIPENYTINNGTRVIADEAFGWCVSLISITIPDSVTSIGEDAFHSCVSLISITIPDSVTSIGEDAFHSCVSLISITIPDSVTSIGNGAFWDCENLTSVTIGDSVTSIGNYAFEKCNSLTSITIPDSVTSIGERAFTGTGYYNNASNWKNGVLYIDNCLIEANSYEIPQNYTINEETRVIAGGAFEFCSSLTDIYILNKNCNIVLPEYPEYSNTIPTETTIHGYAGSTAESYAKEHGNKFDMICDHSNMKKVEAKAATCTEDGNIEYYHCSDCNKNFKDINGNEEVTDVVVKATGHNMAQVAAKAATCTEDGNIEYYHCPDCNKNFKDKDGKEEVADVVVKATGHNMAQVAAKAATCTEDGNIEYYHCPDCNKNFKDINGNEEVTDVVVKATGHKYEDGVCTVCGEKEPVNPSDPTNPDSPKPSGEVSGDGKLSTVDAKWILQNIAKSRDFSDEQFRAADLNGDGKLSVVDVKWVLQIVAGMRDAETLELITK